MGINYRVDNWFLGYERSINPKKGGGGGGHNFKPGTGLKNLQAAGLKKPEVMQNTQAYRQFIGYEGG